MGRSMVISNSTLLSNMQYEMTYTLGISLPVVLDSPTVFVHGSGRAHAIEQLVLLPVPLNDLPS